MEGVITSTSAAGPSQLQQFGAALSQILGWIYFLAWSVSFYPQLLQNRQRRSVTGLSLDFYSINIFGFLVYTISTALFLLSPVVRRQYAERHPEAPSPSVQYNDLAFGLHALLLTTLVWSQFWFWGYKREASQRLGPTITGIMIGNTLAVAIVGFMAYTHFRDWNALDVVYALGYVKLVVTFVKYIPQIQLNYQRRSTVGWSIHNILLDTTGGVFSLAQLFLDSALAGDLWGGTFGNPMKLGLGLVSLFFDAIFLAQHYYWFKGNDPLISRHDNSGVQYGAINAGAGASDV